MKLPQAIFVYLYFHNSGDAISR